MPPGCARLARSPRRSSRSAGSTGVTSRLGSDQRRRGVGVSEISRVGVIGSGLMGSGIAEVCARAGLDVLVTRSEEHTSELQSQSNLVCRLLLENQIDTNFYQLTPELTVDRFAFSDHNHLPLCPAALAFLPTFSTQLTSALIYSLHLPISRNSAW